MKRVLFTLFSILLNASIAMIARGGTTQAPTQAPSSLSTRTSASAATVAPTATRALVGAEAPTATGSAGGGHS